MVVSKLASLTTALRITVIEAFKTIRTGSVSFRRKTPESSLGYCIEVLNLLFRIDSIIRGQVHFSFRRLQLTRLEYYYGGGICHYYFLAVC